MSGLIDRYWDDAHRAAYLIVRDRHAAEDIAQEAMLSAISAIDRFDRRRPFAPWLHRVVANRAVDWMRAKNRRPEISVAETPMSRDELRTTGEGISAEMLVALGCLEPEQRVAVVLRYLLGYRASEIARMMDTPPATVRTRLRRALIQLRAAYEQAANTQGAPR